MNKKTKTTQTHFEELMGKDCWHADELGLSFSAEDSHYWLQFTHIHPCWLKEISKKFIYQQASTKTYATCLTYIHALTSFGKFITKTRVSIKPEEINRKLMVDYIHELCAVKKITPSTVQSYLGRINYFF